MAGPKYAPDAMIDAALSYVAGATALRVCSVLGATPTRAQAVTATLATVAVSGADFANADDATGALGRKCTVAAKSGLSVTVSANAENIVLDDGTNIRYMTSCTTQALTSGNTVNVPTWKIQIGDPT